MNKKVVLFTANVQGGILQLTLQLYKTLKEEKFNVCVVMPCEIQDINIGNIAKADLIQYHKQKKVIDQKLNSKQNLTFFVFVLFKKIIKLS